MVWSELEKVAARDPIVSGLLGQYVNLWKTNNRCITTLLQLYEEQLINLKRDNNYIDLTVAQIAVLRAEMKALERECDFWIRSGYGENKFSIPPNAIHGLTSKLKEKFRSSILRALVTNELF